MLGPAMFVGLTVFVLATQGEPEIEWIDPAQTMVLEEIVKADDLAVDAFPIDDPLVRPVAVEAGAGPERGVTRIATAAMDTGAVPVDRLPWPVVIPSTIPLQVPAVGRLQSPPTSESFALNSIATPVLALTQPDSPLRVVPEPFPFPSAAQEVAYVTLPNAGQTPLVPQVDGKLTLEAVFTGLATPDTGVAPVRPTPRAWAQVQGLRVNVRIGPDLGAVAFFQVDTGRRGLVLDTVGDWHMMHFPGRRGPVIGWVNAAFVQLAGTQ